MAAAPNAGSSHDHCHHLATRIPELKEFIDHQLATKGYGNVSEYFRSPLREAQKEEEDARPETLLKAWRSGPIFRLRRNSGGTSRPKRGSSPRSTRRGSGRERYYSPKGADDIPGNFAGIWVEQYAHDAAFRFLKAVEASIERLLSISCPTTSSPSGPAAAPGRTM
jgi:Arc/MetJ-type ribon-helix-helix transcriptional regulator